MTPVLSNAGLGEFLPTYYNYRSDLADRYYAVPEPQINGESLGALPLPPRNALIVSED